MLRQIVSCCVIVVAAMFVFSCDDDDNKPSGQYADGLYVVNEGNFGAGNGTVTHYSDAKVATQNVFGLVNNNLALGDVVQSMTIDDNVGYIVVNNSKKVEVVNASTFESLYTINGLSLPRYLTVEDNFAYVTEWVSFTDPGRVSVVDLDTRTVVDKITVGFGAENILEDEDLLYVSNNFTNTVSVIDIDSRKVIKTIEVGASPGELLEDANGKIWVLCGGTFGGKDGVLVQLDPSKSKNENDESVVKTIALDLGIGFPKATMSPDRQNIYYFSGQNVYHFNISATGPEHFLEEVAATSFYGIGIDRRTNVIYVADSKAFGTLGKVFRYQLSGGAIDSFEAGIGPGRFAFHE